jgi:long-chain acyl-CoA synthetase
MTERNVASQLRVSLPPMTGPAMTYAQTIRQGASRRPEAVVLVCGDERRTWSELLVRSSKAAQGMLEAGVRHQDRVVFVGRNCLEFFEILYGASMAGAVPSGINWRLAAQELRAVLNDSQAHLLFISAEFLPKLAEIRADLRHVRTVVVLGGACAGEPGAASDEGEGYVDYGHWLSRQPAVDPYVTVEPSDIAMQTYTSGTTGRPKGVMHTVSAIAASFSIAETLEISGRTVVLIATPVFHATAAAAVAMTLSAGGRCVIARDADPATLLALIEAHGVTMTILVPTIIRTVLESPAADKFGVPSLGLIVYTASPMSPELLARAMRHFSHVRFLQVYGSTETLGLSALRPEDHRTHPMSAGRLLPDVTLRVVDPVTGAEAGDGSPGEIWAKAPTAMNGYWGLAEETARTITDDGFVKTGDIGLMQDGFLTLLDRVKDMIVSGGENIYPAEVENVLSAHPGVSEVAVVGVPSDTWGETVMAFVVRAPSAGPRLTEDEVIAYARAHLASYKCPTSVSFIDVLPRNPSGKVLKTVLREPFWKGQARRIG